MYAQCLDSKAHGSSPFQMIYFRLNYSLLSDSYVLKSGAVVEKLYRWLSLYTALIKTLVFYRKKMAFEEDEL